MKSIAIINQKGGVAKSATTLNLAAILAHDYHKRVLVVDADSQCNTTEFLGGDSDFGNLAEILRDPTINGERAYFKIQQTDIEDVSLLAGDEGLMDLDLTKVELQSVQAQCLLDLRAYIESLDRMGRFDYLLADCPPAFNAASTAVLMAVDEVIIPTKLDAFALRGMSHILRQISNMRTINPRLRLLGILPTMWYQGKRIEDAEAQLRGSGLPVLPHIRYSRKVDDMTHEQDPLVTYSPHSAACVDYRILARKIVEGGPANE